MTSQAAALREQPAAVLDLFLSSGIVLGRLGQRNRVAFPIDDPGADRRGRLIQLQAADQLFKQLELLFARKILAFLVLDFGTPFLQGGSIFVLPREIVVTLAEQVVSNGGDLDVGEVALLSRQHVRGIVAQPVKVGHFCVGPEIARRLDPFLGPGLIRLFADAVQTGTDLPHCPRRIEWNGPK